MREEARKKLDKNPKHIPYYDVSIEKLGKKMEKNI